jgi:uncharacterized protein (DUF924 family)
MCSQHSTVDEILNFWFGQALIDANALAHREQVWFRADPEFDREVKEKFGTDLESAINSDLSSWKNSPRARLAGIVLLDQFSRNVYRGTSKAFAGDRAALDLCMEGLARSEDQDLHPIERTFFYMPMQHSEQLAIQEQSVRKFAELLSHSPNEIRTYLQSSLQFAIEHRDIVKRFGRFPHRNKILGRQSTPEEQEFLRTEGKRYGQ